MAGTSAVRFPSAQPATGLPSFQRPPHHRRPRDGVENSTPRMLSLDKLKPLVGQTPSVAEFGANSAIGNVPSTNINLILAKEPRSLSGRRPDPLRKSPI